MANGQAYLVALKKYLDEQVEKGRMTAEEAEGYGQEAVRLLNTGVFGQELPFAGAIFAKREWYKRDPEWRLGPEAGAPLAEQAFRHYTELGLPPATAWQTAQAATEVAPSLEGLPPRLRELMESGLSASEAMAWLRMNEPEEEAGFTDFQRAQVANWERQAGLAERKFEWQMGQPTGPQWRPGELELQQQEAQRGLLGEQARLAALGDKGFIEGWYAENAPTAQDETEWIPHATRMREIERMTGENPIDLYLKDIKEIRREMKETGTAETPTVPRMETWTPEEGKQQAEPATGFYETLESGKQYAIPDMEQWSHNAFLMSAGKWPTGTGMMTPIEKALSGKRLTGEEATQVGARGFVEKGGGYFSKALGGFLPTEPGEGREQFRTPPTPQYPWLAQVAPGLGERLGQWTGQTKVPSGQLWGTIPPSEKARFGAMLQWRRGTGEQYRSPEDLMAQMGRMAPRTPPRTRGWQPAVRR